MAKFPLDTQKWFRSLPISIRELYTSKFKNPATLLLERTLNELLIINFTLWGYENESRRRDLPDKDIANLKRNIDKANQKRHDLIDTIDKVLQEDIQNKIKPPNKSLPMNSETPGSILDRLIVLALRIYNLKKETMRKDADKSHIERCSYMLKEVEERSKDLLNCLEDLLEDYYSGKRQFKSYKQYKLYNDPKLNPSLRKPRSKFLRIIK